MSRKKFRIEVASPPDKEYLIAEIWFEELMIAEINQEKGFYEIEVYSLFGKSVKFDFENFMDILSEAKQRLNALK